jgi:hypothetical protein
MRNDGHARRHPTNMPTMVLPMMQTTESHTVTANPLAIAPR